MNRSISYSYILGILYIGTALLEFLNPAFARAIVFNPHALLHNGEIWRLFTYPLVQGIQSGGQIGVMTFIGLFFRVAILLYICQPLENLWGPKRLLIIYGISVLGGPIVATTIYLTTGKIIYLEGMFIELTLMLIHGLVYASSTIYLMFFLPVRVFYIALFGIVYYGFEYTRAYGLIAVPIMAGFLAGFLYWWWSEKGKHKVAEKAKAVSPAEREKKKATNQIKALDEKGQEVVRDFLTKGELSPKQAKWLDELDKNADFDEEICAPVSFNPDGNICPTCKGFPICLKRRTRTGIEEIEKNRQSGESGETS